VPKVEKGNKSKQTGKMATKAQRHKVNQKCN